MKTENFRKILKITSPIISKLNPKIRFHIASLIRSEGIRTLFDPNSIRNYADIRSKSFFKLVKLKSGMRASLDVNDIIGFRTALNKDWDSTSLEIVKKFPVKETLYIDIGANTGLTSIPIALIGYETVAFEPNPYALMQLTKNLTLNSPILYYLFPFALGARGKDLEYVMLHSPIGNMGATSIDPDWSPSLSNSNKIYAPLISLESAISCIFPLERLKEFKYLVIKLDVEGYEDQVIEGMGEVLKSLRPVVIFENNPPKKESATSERFWSKFDNYKLAAIYNGRIEDFIPNKRYENVLAIPIEITERILGYSHEVSL